ncbi:MAG: hypothetical protein R2697_18340 [Ilumatobacteraceae bacterium]
MTDQERSPTFSSDEPPLIRGGSESVHLVTRHRASASSWRHADRAVDSACNHYDDACAGEITGLECRVLPDGRVEFHTELALSTKFRPAAT